MRRLETKLIIGGLFCLLLLMSSWQVLSQTQTKQTTDKDQKEQLPSLLEKANRIVIFRLTGGERSYVGHINRDTSIFRQIVQSMEKAQVLKPEELSRVDYELAFVGEGMYRLARYDTQKDLMTFYHPTKNELERDVTIHLNDSLRRLISRVSFPKKSSKKFVPKHMGKGMMMVSPPLNLVDLVNSSLIILIGHVVDVDRNFYVTPNDLMNQRTTYIVAVERYLKDDTGLYLPVVGYIQQGGFLGGGFFFEGDAPVEVGERYLLSLRRGGEFAVYNRQTVRVAYPFEYPPLHPYVQVCLKKGRTHPIDPNADANTMKLYLFNDKKTTLVGKPEGVALAEIRGAIKEVNRLLRRR
jgi:hypothetical protein